MDRFEKFVSELDSPAKSAFAITPNNTTDFAISTRAIYVGGGGDVAVTMQGGGNVVFAGVNTGTILPIRVSKVMATGTTATNMVGLY